MSTGSGGVFQAVGDAAQAIERVTWVLFVGGGTIFVGVMLLLAWALCRRAGTVQARWWTWGAGVAFPTVVLVVLFVWVLPLTPSWRPVPPPNALIITVKAHMWWWEVRYRDPATGNDILTANEIRIPVGRPVYLALTSADVIHSFWVPQLAGKMDMLPGRMQHLLVTATEPGTWRPAVVNDGLRVQWRENGLAKRWNGPVADFFKSVPANAEKLSVNEVASRVETFVTMGAPTPLKLSGEGLEVRYDTHPNDLVTSAPATLTFFQGGQPAPKLKVSIIPGGARYRDSTKQIDLITDEQGQVQIHWPAAGLYWVNAVTRAAATVPQAKHKTLSYAVTLEASHAMLEHCMLCRIAA